MGCDHRAGRRGLCVGHREEPHRPECREGLRRRPGRPAPRTGSIRAAWLVVRVTGPLQDLLVVDLSRALAGPHATMMLGDLGARVLKVEAPGRGDDTRGGGPPFVGDPTDPVST